MCVTSGFEVRRCGQAACLTSGTLVGDQDLFAGLKHVAIKIIASYTEDQIITTNPAQVLAIKKAKQDLEMSGGMGANVVK